MVEYPLKVIFSAGIVFFIPLQGYEKRNGRAAQRKLLYGKIAVFRRLVCLLKAYYQLMLNCLQLSGEQFRACRIPEYFPRVFVYPRFNGFYALVAYSR